MPRMELKYCEGCGGLLLRPAGSPATYCPSCRKRLQLIAIPSDKPETRGRKPKPAPDNSTAHTNERCS